MDTKLAFATPDARKSCDTLYWYDFVLDSTPGRVPIPWTNGLNDVYLCAEHLQAIRLAHLEDYAELGW